MVDTARVALNAAYDRFVGQYGVIDDPRIQRLFRDLPELQFLLALERNPRQRPSGRWCADKERIFRERTVRPQQRLLPGSLTPTEAVLCCLDQRGSLDLASIATLVGTPVETVLAQLGARIYRLPGTDQYALADVYLSGDVRAKLQDARTWAERDPAFARNVTALAAVQSEPLGPREIIVNLNAFWLPSTIIDVFIRTLLPAWTGTAQYRTSLSEWLLTDPGGQGANAVEAATRWGTTRADAITILRASLRGMPITVYDVVLGGRGEQRILNAVIRVHRARPRLPKLGVRSNVPPGWKRSQLSARRLIIRFHHLISSRMTK